MKATRGWPSRTLNSSTFTSFTFWNDFKTTPSKNFEFYLTLSMFDYIFWAFLSYFKIFLAVIPCKQIPARLRRNITFVDFWNKILKSKTYRKIDRLNRSLLPTIILSCFDKNCFSRGWNHFLVAKKPPWNSADPAPFLYRVTHSSVHSLVFFLASQLNRLCLSWVELCMLNGDKYNFCDNGSTLS